MAHGGRSGGATAEEACAAVWPWHGEAEAAAQRAMVSRGARRAVLLRVWEAEVCGEDEQETTENSNKERIRQVRKKGKEINLGQNKNSEKAT